MPLQSTSGAASYDAFGGGVAAKVNYIEDFFQSYLRTGTGASATVTTGLDGSTKETLVWTKSRSAATNHKLTDNVRGATKALSSNTTAAEATDSQGLTAFSATGYTIGTNTDYNNSGSTYVDWQWVSQPKFFDVVTWTGDGNATQTISHNLGSVPGCLIYKVTSQADDWYVYHRSLSTSGGVPYWMNLNSTSGQMFFGGGVMLSAAPTSTTFTVKGAGNGAGNTYVAYLFAHDAGGFGLTGTDNVISCGSFTTDGSGNASVNLGYEPQFWLYKPTIAARYWTIYDVMRGWSQTEIRNLNPNVADAEGGGAATLFYPTATGFDCVGGGLDASTQHIYIAIRRGPMKVPTSGTSVFSPNTTSAATGTAITTNFPVDLQMLKYRSGAQATMVLDRLRGISTSTTEAGNFLQTSNTNAEVADNTVSRGWNNTGYQVASGWTLTNQINWNFRRAPSFFDEVCYTGTGSATTQTHNLGVVPELMIIKRRTNNDGAGFWAVYSAATGATKFLTLNAIGAENTNSTFWNNTSPTSSVFTVGTITRVNGSAETYVAYLFATCPGVSKVGSYTGTGATQTISCGFTGGARFVMVKATSATGNWVVVDTARGMVAGTDPYLNLNTTAAEVNANNIYTTTGGFQLVSSDANTNANGTQYLYLAIA